MRLTGEFMSREGISLLQPSPDPTREPLTYGDGAYSFNSKLDGEGVFFVKKWNA